MLGDLYNFVGGEDHAHILLKPLEILASGEDNTVRDHVSFIAKIDCSY